MRNDKQVWTERVWTSLRSVPTGATVAQLEAVWHDHRRRSRPVAAIFGAYDAGKSSLLKRLLFEDGVEIPDGLTVSGRRETFSVDEVDGSTWTYRDSPGIAGGNEEHDQMALESLDLADLLVWVLPPQLVTDAKETFDSIATGARFAVRPQHVSDSMLAVISRIDEAGIDAATNSEGFSELCARKESEFTALLSSVGVAAPCFGILPVSADPYQGVGNEIPDASIYAMGEGWDGVPELRAALERAAQQAEELRTLAGYRYASGVVHVLSKAVLTERGEREEALQACANELERLNLWSRSLLALRGKCAADLHRAVEDELLSASRTGTAASAEALHQKLSAAIDRWGDQAYADFEQLAASAEQEAGQRARSASMERLRRLIVDMGEAEIPSLKRDIDGKVKKHAWQLGRTFREGFKAYARVDLGMSTEQAAKQIRELQESGKTWAAFSKAKGKGNTFASEAVAKKASKYVKWAEALDAFGPLVEQLGSALYEIGGDVLSAMEADRKAERRRELREALRIAAADVEAEAMTGFDEMTSKFSEWLHKKREVQVAAKSSLEAQVATLNEYESTLHDLMSSRPD